MNMIYQSFLKGFFFMYIPKKILIPLGALMAFGVITGAIFFHLFTPLGINVQDDGGTLFFMASGVWVSSGILILMHKSLILKTLCRKN